MSFYLVSAISSPLVASSGVAVVLGRPCSSNKPYFKIYFQEKKLKEKIEKNAQIFYKIMKNK